MILAALVQHEFDVLMPFGDGHPYDLVLCIRHSIFVRVQCKTAWARGGCLIFNCRTTDHGRGPQSYEGLADVFGVFFPPAKAVYLIPVSDFPGFEGRLRLEPAKNNQKKRVKLAEGYELDNWTAASLSQVVSRAPLATGRLATVA
jgi:hypothetical protein